VTEPKEVIRVVESDEENPKVYPFHTAAEIERLLFNQGASGFCSEDDPDIVVQHINDLENGGTYRLHYGPKSVVSVLTAEAEESKGFRRNYAAAWEEKVSLLLGIQNLEAQSLDPIKSGMNLLERFKITRLLAGECGIA